MTLSIKTGWLSEYRVATENIDKAQIIRTCNYYDNDTCKHTANQCVCSSKSIGDLKCTGAGKIDHNYLCLDMHSQLVDTSYHTHHRYDLTWLNLNSNKKCLGMWLSVNANRKLECGGSIISSDSLDEETIKSLIKSNYRLYKSTQDVPVITLSH